MVITITDILNQWNQLGIFSYAIPFLIIFAVVFAILEKTGLLGDNRPIMSIVSVAIGLSALQFDYVSEFFAVIFPRFGIGLSIFLVLLILIGFFVDPGNKEGFAKKLGWIGWVTGLGVVIWSLSSWDSWTSYYGFGGWFAENIWSIIVLAVLIALIIIMSKGKGESK